MYLISDPSNVDVHGDIRLSFLEISCTTVQSTCRTCACIQGCCLIWSIVYRRPGSSTRIRRTNDSHSKTLILYESPIREVRRGIITTGSLPGLLTHDNNQTTVELNVMKFDIELIKVYNVYKFHQISISILTIAMCKKNLV